MFAHALQLSVWHTWRHRLNAMCHAQAAVRTLGRLLDSAEPRLAATAAAALLRLSATPSGAAAALTARVVPRAVGLLGAVWSGPGSGNGPDIGSAMGSADYASLGGLRAPQAALAPLEIQPWHAEAGTGDDLGELTGLALRLLHNLSFDEGGRAEMVAAGAIPQACMEYTEAMPDMQQPSHENVLMRLEPYEWLHPGPELLGLPRPLSDARHAIAIANAVLSNASFVWPPIPPLTTGAGAAALAGAPHGRAGPAVPLVVGAHAPPAFPGRAGARRRRRGRRAAAAAAGSGRPARRARASRAGHQPHAGQCAGRGALGVSEGPEEGCAKQAAQRA